MYRLTYIAILFIYFSNYWCVVSEKAFFISRLSITAFFKY